MKARKIAEEKKVGRKKEELGIRLVSRQPPLRSTATHAALPAMSLIPVAPFAEASADSGLWRDLPSSDYVMASKTAP
jgi:hypothetical protein